ncbi:hypothetical protein BS47DRAFT_1389362 [Hydnum rufescens UP504]|uniref:L-ornithine N(5)-monooxygenase [NAD(P)H] n=1 Tax=Hydnum rufescens UP504 TaxID=1448309 RepID=A0A9P6B5X0_9AGAM|nr:hypothetical protein BS47DRAFT_1389362 [Hydnum rufescens UP504]
MQWLRQRSACSIKKRRTPPTSGPPHHFMRGRPVTRCLRIIHTSVYARFIDQTSLSISVRFRAPNSSQGANVSPLRIAVVGGDQSTAEALLNLHGGLSSIPLHHDNHGEVSLDASTRAHSIDLIIRKGSLKPSDDSPFTDEIFDLASTNFKRAS